MTIEDALKILLRAVLSTDRVWSHKAPQSLPSPVDDPYVVIFRISPTPRHGHSGPTPTIERRYQFSVFGRSQSATAAMADSLRRALDGYQGTVTDNASPQSSLRISSSLWAGETYGYNDATERHHFAVDMQIKYTES